jgi:hypothetical protein
MAAGLEHAGTQDGFLEGERFCSAKRNRLKRRARLRQGRRMHLHRPVAKRFRRISVRIAFIAGETVSKPVPVQMTISRP